ncbi:hypothetical protein AOZ06_34495 [Kibdelosporangium phytohabitans]|uniref:Uncharacterized protein n=1 Tax=Kibdelosporangium phytohabitans TaxID=860235 RepID=A0A0N9HVF2_9PSEU|nr:hypothetical protein AOZ06_34495 [Kibdelosporangium phytohabitans]
MRTTQPSASSRRATVLVSAVAARRDFIRESIEQPSIRLEQTSLTAQRYSLPSAVRCSVMRTATASSVPWR